MNRLQKIIEVQAPPSRPDVNAAGLVDRDERFASRRFIEALRRVLGRTVELDRDAIDVVVWVLGPAQGERLLRELVAALGSKTEKMLVPLYRDSFGDAERARLADMGPLTPGDFSVVATQARWRDAMSFDELSAALAAETSYRAKPRPIGFVASATSFTLFRAAEPSLSSAPSANRSTPPPSSAAIAKPSATTVATP